MINVAIKVENKIKIKLDHMHKTVKLCNKIFKSLIKGDKIIRKF